ncbi:MAG: PorV/PorQ family protein [Candidatus Glassbacteria bacterium]|nr:PorV/PorQ family protein [Candidatus Glassbacteria bacterium]
MRKYSVVTTLIAAAALLWWSPSSAISPDAGTTSLNFLKVGVGARAAALGGAYNAVSDDASACFWNPAGLVEAQPLEMFFMHHRFIEDISQSAAGFTFDLRQVRLGVSMNYFSMGELERRTGNSVVPDGVFTPFDMALGVSAAYRINENISAGVTGRFVHEDLDSETARSILFDLGIKAQTTIPGLVAALTVSNLGSRLKYDLSGYDAPRLISLGAAYRKTLPWEYSTLLVTAQATVPNDNETRFALGGEYGYKDFLFGRVGYRSGLDYEDFSFGFGVLYRKLRFDYAFVPYSDLGNSHRFSFIYGFKDGW